MVPRPRKAGSKDLPPNLYRKTDKRNGKTYYTYRDPLTGRMFGLGQDKEAAIKEAVTANHAPSLTLNLTERIAEPVALADRKFSDWMVEYRRIYSERELSKESMRAFKNRSKRLEDAFGDRDIRAIRTMDVANYLTGIAKEGKAAMSKTLRSLLSDAFNEAIAAGWCEQNPVMATKAARVKVKRMRLSLAMWEAIYAATEKPWLKRAMELALLTGQRLEDVQSMQFRDEHDKYLHVIQSKTKARLRISVDLRLGAIDLDLATVIKRCRDRVLSANLVHHTKSVARAKAGSPLTPDTLSREFSATRNRVAKRDGIVFSGTPPTFHEMRSLAARLHASEGRDAQKLLGHRSSSMTDVYKDSRGTEWIDVA